jgi:hypothetical protein
MQSRRCTSDGAGGAGGAGGVDWMQAHNVRSGGRTQPLSCRTGGAFKVTMYIEQHVVVQAFAPLRDRVENSCGQNTMHVPFSCNEEILKPGTFETYVTYTEYVLY